MICVVFLSALLVWPVSSAFIDGYNLPKAVFLSILAVVAGCKLLRVEALRLPLLLQFAAVMLLSIPSFTMTSVPALTTDLTGMLIFWWIASTVEADRIPRIVTFAVAVGAVQAVAQIWGWRFSEDLSADGIITMSVPLAFWFLCEGKSGGWLTRAAVPALAITNLWQTGRRAAFASLAIGCGIAYWPALSKKGRAIVAVLVALSLVFGFWVFSERGFSLRDRIAAWSGFLQLVSWIGVGRGNFEIASYSLVKYVGDHKEIWAEAHNDYLQFLIEVGPLATVAWIWLLWSAVWRKPQTPLGLALAVSLWTVLIRAFFHFPFQLPAEVAWFWTLAGLYWVETDAKKNYLSVPNDPDCVCSFDSATFRRRAGV